MTMHASVVVPTYRRPDLLGRCLSALEVQDFDPARYEVIVADDASSAHTRNLVDQWQARGQAVVRYVRVTGAHGPAAARNAGWRAAKGKIIAFTDDDCLPDRSWLKAGISAFEPGVVAAAGRVIVPLGERPTDFEKETAGLERTEFVTANCFCLRSALEQIGGFDEQFKLAWREDSDLQFRLLKLGGQMVRAERAIVCHPVRQVGWGISLRAQRKSLYNALLFKKHRALYRARIQAQPPWHYYGGVAALMASALAGSGGRAGTSALFAAVWAALTVRFCAHRLAGTSHAPGHVAEMLITSALIPPLAVFWRLAGAVKFRVFFV